MRNMIKLLCITMFATNFQVSFAKEISPVDVSLDRPDPELDRYLPADDPALDQAGVLKSVPMLFRGKDTYSYVRCYFTEDLKPQLDTATTSPKTSYVWAKDSSGNYFKLHGYWWSDGVLQWKNMFYSDTNLKTIKDICNETVRKTVSTSSFSFDQYAANNRFSFNHAIWQNNNNLALHNGINKVIAFGDSLSDSNNMYNASQWKLPNDNAWFQGRFSNGRVWTEYLAELMGVPLYNWAIGGAAGDTYIVVPGLKQEVDSWSEYTSEAKDYDPSTSLFTILIGGNDLVNYDRNVEDIVASLSASLDLLISKGAKHIVLLNLPDVTAAPVFKMGKSVPNLKENVLKFNQDASDLVAKIKHDHPQVQIVLFDTYQLLNQAISNPKEFGITNVTDSCLDINTDNALNYITSHDARKSCSNANQFIFWDSLHITSNIHRILANRIVEQVKVEFH